MAHPERLVLPPGVKVLDSREILTRVERFVDQSHGLDAIIIVGKQGDLATFRCRPTRNLVPSKVGEMLRAGLSKFDQGDPPDDDLEPLIQVAGMRVFSLRETVKRINAFMSHCEGVTLVMLVCRDGDTSKTRRLQSFNLLPGAAREMLRRALNTFDTRGLPAAP